MLLIEGILRVLCFTDKWHLVPPYNLRDHLSTLHILFQSYIFHKASINKIFFVYKVRSQRLLKDFYASVYS